MRKIRLKVNHINKGSRDYLGDYLKTLGVKEEDICSFTTMPRATDKDEPFNLNNMERAVDAAYELLSKGASTYVQPDPDTDGYTSSAVLISYLSRRFPNVHIDWKLHTGKEHGIEPEYIDAADKLVFIPDAGSNDYAKQKGLVAQGKTVIILDHHEIEDYQDTGAILVNNQASLKFSNKYMSGVGIVYMFITEMDKKYFSTVPSIADDYLDLTAVGIIADAMNMTSLGNNYIAYYGLNSIHNKFLKELIKKEERGIKDPESLSKISVAFYLAPAINGVIRGGTEEDKNTVFTALITDECNEKFERDYRGTHYVETLWEKAARLAVNAKGRQDAAKKKGFETICELIRKNGWDKHNLIIATLDEKTSAKINPNFTGLIAMELVKEFNKPCLVLRDTEYNGEKVFGGSGRNGNFYGLPNLLDFLLKSNLTVYAAGHGNAFGVFVKYEDIAMLRKYADENLDSKVFTDDIVDVDYWFQADEPIDQTMLMAFAAADKLYGNSIPQPKFAFTLKGYSDGDYRVMGKNLDSVKISHDGVDFVAFKDISLVHELGAHKGGDITLVGRPQVNEWMGRKNIQIMIDEIEVTAASKAEEAAAATEVDWRSLL